MIARKNPDSSVQYAHSDHLGSTSVMTDSNGNAIENTLYEPFGKVISGGKQEDKLYTGQFSDEVDCQYYYGARFYNPCTDVFMQPDSLLPNIFDSQQLNRYSYARNNPYALADDSGHRITYGVENYGGQDVIAIYQDDSYIGKVTSEIETTTVYPSVFENAPGVSVTSHDYSVRRGDKTLGTDGVPVIIDAFKGQEERLSSITFGNRERLLRQENLELAKAMSLDVLDLLTLGSSNVPESLSWASRAGTAYSVLSAGSILNKFLALVPLTSTATTYLSQNLGYQAGSKIPEFKGYTKRESGTLNSGGVVRKTKSSNFVTTDPSGRGPMLVTIRKIK